MLAITSLLLLLIVVRFSLMARLLS